mmetsp:Transcript_93189/g.263113  ORF Transcript_93189/g.263113 Transcript_93189/m.263113 type:complete len:213 (-) Transcript_93189:505-1143(-)
MRWARASACSTAPGTQYNSAKMTRLAAVNVKPSLHAVMDNNAKRQVSCAWNCFTRSMRLFAGVLPSMRMYVSPSLASRFARTSSSASMTSWWCAKMMTFSSQRSTTSRMYSFTAGNFALAMQRNIVDTPSLSSSPMRSPPVEPVRCFRISFKSFLSVISKGTFWRRFSGNSSRTSFLSLRTITPLVNKWFNSSVLREPTTRFTRRPPGTCCC